jgi:ubiquinone/menaquinone biosynthesis C-methylase UbiE
MIYNKLKFPKFIDPESKSPLFKSGDFLKGENEELYEIIDSIPRILKDKSNYCDAFGQQWLNWRETQLDSFTKTKITEVRLKRCLGSDLCNDLQLNERTVLEVGCGAGRFTEVFLKSFPKLILSSVDLSNAVEANQINFPQNERHQILQADATKLPYENNSFDLVVCLGVIQHTPNPEDTIEELFKKVKPGGTLVIDHYTKSFSFYTKLTAQLLRPIVKRMSYNKRMKFVKLLTNTFFPVHKLLRNIPLGQTLFSRVSPLLTYYHTLPELSHENQYNWALLDTHDHLADWYKHLRSKSEISAVLSNLGGINIWVEKGGNGIEARCKK